MTRASREGAPEKIAHKVGRLWGFGSGTSNDPGPWEGELRNMLEADATDRFMVP